MATAHMGLARPFIHDLRGVSSSFILDLKESFAKNTGMVPAWEIKTICKDAQTPKASADFAVLFQGQDSSSVFPNQTPGIRQKVYVRLDMSGWLCLPNQQSCLTHMQP